MIENKTPPELRKFALIMTAALGLIAALLWWRHKAAAPYLGTLSGLFLVSGLAWPRLLAPIEWAWMKLAYWLGTVMTIVIVTLTFYLVITPVGFLMRLIGKDLLSLKLDKGSGSYWVPVEADGPCSRPDKPY